jgi:hypothetical protein
MALYPADFRAEFGSEMREVFALRTGDRAVRELSAPRFPL